MALDEAQYIKNHTTKIAKAVKAVAADHRFALTGTPIENRLSELWSIFDFLMPGLLGSYKRFHERYELPISNARAADGSTAEGRAAAQVNPEAARVSRQLQSLVGVFIKRRLKSQVLTDLPDKLETTLTVRLAGEQRKLYAAHEQRLRMQLEHSEEADFNTSKIRILAELTKLRQICCDPRLLYADAKDQSAKLAAITELVETCVNEGKKALIFSQFTSFLDLIAERFDAQGLRYYTITGSTPKKKRLELVDQFNADDTPAFLISLKAGNTGLNLTGASVVIHADPWWNAAAQDQPPTEHIVSARPKTSTCIRWWPRTPSKNVSWSFSILRASSPASSPTLPCLPTKPAPAPAPSPKPPPPSPPSPRTISSICWGDRASLCTPHPD